MFGTFRYILALGVVLTHLWPSSWRWAGYYSVFAFYMLSGYLMTLVLNERYGFSLSGLRRFFANRALRIFPPYLAVLALAVVLVLIVPDLARTHNMLIFLPETVRDWLSNIFIIGAGFDRTLSHARLVPPVWSLHVELIFYIAMALLLSRSLKVAVVWFAASVAFTVYAATGGTDFIARYYTVAAGSLPFSTGALIYFLRERLRVPAWVALPAFGALLAHTALAARIWGIPWNIMLYGFYTSFILTFLTIISLRRVDAGRLPGWVVRADKLLGDLSYPLFLCHWHAGLIIVWLGFSGTSPGMATVFFLSVPAATIMAYVIHHLIEKRVNRLRDAVRRGIRPGRARIRLGAAGNAVLTFPQESDIRGEKMEPR